MITMGITISFAGSPKIKAARTAPSSPSSVPAGSKKDTICCRTLTEPIFTFASSQIKRPAGAATAAARARTNSVRSKTERTITLPTCGTARFSSALSVDDFVKKSQFTYYTADALRAVSGKIAAFAMQEGLQAHAKSVTIRFEEDAT